MTLLDYGGAVTWRHLVLDSEGQPGIRSPTKRFSLPLIGPNKKGLHIIGQIIYYVTDLKNVTLLDYGGAVTWRHLVLDSEGQPGINLRPREWLRQQHPDMNQIT